MNTPDAPHVFFSVNTRFMPLLRVALVSLLTKAGGRISVHVLHVEKRNDSHASLMRICEHFGQEIEFIPVESRIFEGWLHRRQRTPLEMILRLAIPALKPGLRKAVYLDCDVLVLDDIQKLWRTPLGNHAAGAARDMWADSARLRFFPQNKDPLDYFNSGVMLLNLDWMRRELPLERCFEIRREVVNWSHLQDQDVLNYAMQGRTLLLPLRWNVQAEFFVRIRGSPDVVTEELLEAVGNPAIVHFSSGLKPWKESPKEHGIPFHAHYQKSEELARRLSASPALSIGKPFSNHPENPDSPMTQDIPAHEEKNGQPSIMKEKVTFLVGVCSARSYANRRAAVRQTWLGIGHENEGVKTRILFFHGKGANPTENPEDTVELAAKDGYDFLPGKVLEFFRHALEHFDFEWLFKCDDDTYLAVDRLPSLLEKDVDFIGDAMLAKRRAPSGGAGYLMSREIVEKLTRFPNLPQTGPEDLLLGRIIVDKLKARWHSTPKLCHDHSRAPRPGNDIVSSHWCTPQRLLRLHNGYQSPPDAIYEATHSQWKDKVLFSKNGFFARLSSGCTGRWFSDENERLVLRWHDWDAEILKREGLAYRGENFELRPERGDILSIPRAARNGSEDVMHGMENWPDLTSLNSRAILLFRFHSHFPLCRERLRILRHFNPRLSIYALYGGSPQEAEKARQATREFVLGFWDFSRFGDARRKWLRGDLMIREWYEKFGNALNFSFLISHEWDILTAAPLGRIYPEFVSPKTYVSPLQRFSREEEQLWFWTRNGKWRETPFMKHLSANHGMERPRHVTRGPGMVFSREFLEAQRIFPALDGMHDEFVVPALAEALGIPLEDSGFFGNPRNAGLRLWNTCGVELGDIQRELCTPGGMRIFHPVKSLVTLEDIQAWTEFETANPVPDASKTAG
ncbi:MAG: hypothetical protein LBG65_08145 [Puniceicoccales bacterium]|jgi:lipopolysaccharide biosynthesis glycosyltransferase|nr:hypothetical protein [Puniceicoccales bacterium]